MSKEKNSLFEMIKISENFLISSMKEGYLYYSDGIDWTADFTIYTIKNNRFIAALAWKDENGLYFNENPKEKSLYMSADRDAMNDMTVEEGYINVLCYSSLEGGMESWKFKEDLSELSFMDYLDQYTYTNMSTENNELEFEEDKPNQEIKLI